MSAQAMSPQMAMAAMLGLQPLDRVQINSRQTINESRVGARREGGSTWSQELPWWFFQRITVGGRLEVMTGGGYVSEVDPQEICDFRPADPVKVMAMPPEVFLARLSLSPAEMRKPAPPTDYAPAFVRYVTKDKWHRVDCVAVEFEDQALNQGSTAFSLVRQQDMEMLAKVARRDRMPVVESMRCTMASADKGEQQRADLTRYAAAAFLRLSLLNLPETVTLRDALRESGSLPELLTPATINRMESKLRTGRA